MSLELGEIVVNDGVERRLPITSVRRIALAAIARQDGASMDQIVRQLPAAHVQTNSRGETLVYLRNAGERQVALFFDGAALNIPWDNRLDLSFIPSSMVGGITIAKGVPSVLYGTNVLGGALNLTSRELAREGDHTEAAGGVGSAGLRQGHLTHLGRRGRFSYAGSVGYVGRDGITLPDGADLPFSQRASLRTNTDKSVFNAFARGSYRFGPEAVLGVSVLHVGGEKGVAPEGHLDPAVDQVRFWRYPDWRNTMLISNGEAPLGARTRLRGALWAGAFTQTIDQFTSDAYDTLGDREEDDDVSLGTRLTLLHELARGQLRFALNALASRHRQRDTAFDAAGTPSADPRLTYSQHIFSLGAEYEGTLSERARFVLGSSLDGIATPATGDKPSRDPITAVGVTSGFIYSMNEALAFKASAGRKVRFPTMRELFSGALNTFLINPDLKPEASLLGEVGLALTHEYASGELVVFANRTFDTIDQQRVTIDGVRYRQRINLDGSRVWGVEVVGATNPARMLTLEGHLTYTDTRAFEEDGTTRELVEKPAWLGTLTAVQNTPWGLSLMAEGVLTGRAYSFAPDNSLVSLPTSLRLNARVAYRILMQERGIFGEVFFRVDNLTDVVAEPQRGLPDAGREVQGGLSISI